MNKLPKPVLWDYYKKLFLFVVPGCKCESYVYIYTGWHIQTSSLFKGEKENGISHRNQINLGKLYL